MTQRLLAFVVAAAGLLLFTVPSPGQSCGATAPPRPELIQRTYPVADLVLPDYPHARPVDETLRKANEDQLIKLITNTIVPQCWVSVGGDCTIDYFPLGCAFVISAPPDVHEQVAALLEELRQTRDLNVAVEVRVVSISPAMAEGLRWIGIDCACRQEQPAAYVSDWELFLLMEWLQQDSRTNVMQAPKLTVLNGQCATVGIQDFQWFVTDVQVVQSPYCGIVFVPQNYPVKLGFELGVQPVISADRRSVSMKVNAQLSGLVADPPRLSPVSSFITVYEEDGTPRDLVPFIQYIQKPEFNRLRLDQVLCIPDNQTAILSGWKFQRETLREESWDSVLSWLRFIPGIDLLFKPAEPVRETDHVLVLVTPRIIKSTEEEIVSTGVVECVAAPAAAPVEAKATPETKKAVARLLARYRKAQKEGRYADAEKLARKARALDPNCFDTGNR